MASAGDAGAAKSNGDAAPQKASALRGKKRPLDGSHTSETATGVSWDEANLAEHDKERGTRRKIDEPKTPWAPSPVSSEDEGAKSPKSPEGPKAVLDAAALSAHLEKLNESQAAGGESRQPSTPASVRWANTGPSKTSSDAFKAKRAAHYNEFRMLQAFRNNKLDGESESEDSAK
mmetsp:Transcript_41168/g.65244  ORF Transcript_41168/g.65244 Transcript_41168/m.65244 type:complete len:175 (-) Transcript_41168:43-567(-)